MAGHCRGASFRSLLSATPAPDSLAMLATAAVPFDSTRGLTEKAERMRRSKAGVPKEMPKTASKNNFWEDIVGKRGIKKERKHIKRI